MDLKAKKIGKVYGTKSDADPAKAHEVEMVLSSGRQQQPRSKDRSEPDLSVEKGLIKVMLVMRDGSTVITLGPKL